MSNRLEQEAYDYFARIRDLGGVDRGDQGELLPARDRRGLSALARLKREAAEADTNLMTAIIDASRAHVTMGEMCDALRESWGVRRETPVV